MKGLYINNVCVFENDSGEISIAETSALDITYFGSFELSKHCIYVVNQCNEAYHIFQDQVQQE